MTLYYDESGNEVYTSFGQVPSYRIDKVKKIKNTKGKDIVTINNFVFITSEGWNRRSTSKEFVFLSKNESLEKLSSLWIEELEERDQEFKAINIDIDINKEKSKELERLKQQKKEIEEKIKSLEK